MEKDIDLHLEAYLPTENELNKNLIRAVKHSLLAKGKKIRPRLLLEFCRVCGGDAAHAMPFACAVEMVHTYSLIHDDLPCMDDAPLRRGIASNHKAYGEATAILAGDALLTMAFSVMLNRETLAKVDANRAALAASTLAEYAGVNGMVGGQAIDLAFEGKNAKLSVIEQMNEKKTAYLIMAAAEMGCVIAGAPEEKILAAREYARALGLAFQIIDDILDKSSSSENLGKPIGSDAALIKANYVAALGLEEAAKLAENLTNKAVNSLNCFDADTSLLKEFALSMKNRDK